MSGGERQRLALARALLRKPALLILDEPTSALDQQNEQSVLDAIERLKGQTTIILVTHRPERVQKADQVLLQVRHTFSGCCSAAAQRDALTRPEWTAQPERSRLPKNRLSITLFRYNEIQRVR